MPRLATFGSGSSRSYGLLAKTAAAPGSQSYTTAGTYTWVAPAGVTKVSIVAVGGLSVAVSGLIGLVGGLVVAVGIFQSFESL